MKNIGILTSGGDAPGMNAGIRAVVRTCVYEGIKVKGIRFGYKGLMAGEIIDMDVSSVADIIHRGGTILGTARCPEFKTEEGQARSVEMLKKHKIDGLVVLGGDGSFKGAQALQELGIKVMGIPCTIDNDIGYTDTSIGFDTAVETVVEAISKLRDTTSSHGRGNVLEVMGRDCGDLALYSGLAGGAESIVVPELPYNKEEVFQRVIQGVERGKLHHIIIMAEGVGCSQELAQEIEEITGVSTRVTILGHVQRGGSPTATDRILASKMGSKAVKSLLRGENGLAARNRGYHIDMVGLDQALKTPKAIDIEMFRVARELSI